MIAGLVPMLYYGHLLFDVGFDASAFFSQYHLMRCLVFSRLAAS